ncbi:hypothetical protein [uncultured Roseobacter sp.]|uniref:hypothetical protein n=1 Tax=uncultured Roseobacter sp. TaxID=114847 RepID=UPI002626E5CE|nr:hypothetical protein [uncultured Roseobacter sp.]
MSDGPRSDGVSPDDASDTRRQNRFGPSRGDLTFRAAFAVAGLAMTGFALVWRGLPQGPGGWEAIMISVVFFGGTLIWSLRRLIRRDYPDT